MIAVPAPPAPRRLGTRLLRSSLADLLLGPHGVDRYLELIRPAMTVADARAEVIAVRRQTSRSSTLTLRPNGAWSGFEAGQYVRTGFEIDGVRCTRTYSPAGSEHAARDELELTVTKHPGGLVSPHVTDMLGPGTVVHLGSAQGQFVCRARARSASF
jgi:stearoyl-CoA 9-desaturase NADPH oxidoreductase